MPQPCNETSDTTNQDWWGASFGWTRQSYTQKVGVHILSMESITMKVTTRDPSYIRCRVFRIATYDGTLCIELLLVTHEMKYGDLCPLIFDLSIRQFEM